VWYRTVHLPAFITSQGSTTVSCVFTRYDWPAVEKYGCVAVGSGAIWAAASPSVKRTIQKKVTEKMFNVQLNKLLRQKLTCNLCTSLKFVLHITKKKSVNSKRGITGAGY
jgi:hypothetical protein